MFESAGSHNVSDLINQGASLLSKIGIKNSIFESKLMLSKAINVAFPIVSKPRLADILSHAFLLMDKYFCLE